MAIGRIREITFDDGAIVDGDDVTLADLLNPAEIGSDGIYLDITSGLPTLSPWRGGVVAWDSVNNCMAVSTSYDGSWIQVGEETQDEGINKAGTTLLNGEVVYLDGSETNRPRLYRANAASLANSKKPLGLVTANAGIANGAKGPFTISGLVTNLNTNAYTEGDTLWLSTTDGTFTATKPTNQYRHIMIGIVVKKHLTLGEVYVNIKDITDDYALAGFHIVDPHGFTEYDNTYATPSATGLTFTLTKGSGNIPYFFKGEYKEITATKSITLVATDGMHYIGYNPVTDLLEDLGSSFPVTAAVSTHVLTAGAHVYAGAINYWANERHSTKFPKKLWAYLHKYESTRYDSGLTPTVTSIDGNGSSADHARFSSTSGLIADEDIAIPVAALSSTDTKKVWYRDSSFKWTYQNGIEGSGILNGGGRAYYNPSATGGLTAVASNNDYLLAHLFALNSGEQVIILGQAEYSLLSAARIAANTELLQLITAGLPFTEFRAVATFIYKTNDSYGNNANAIIITGDNGAQYSDWRASGINPIAGSAAANHNALSGLQGGAAAEYYHLSAAQNANITNNIFPSGTASNTQNRILLPTATTAQWAALTPTETLLGWDSTKKKPVVADGTIVKPIGGGLIVTPITVSGTTPSIATLEAGKHYIVDMSTATGDVTVTAPTGASEANWKVTAARNWNNAYRLSIAAAGADKFYYAGDSTTITVIRIYNPDGWVEGCYLTTNLWVLNTDENAGSGASGSGQGRKNYILNPSAATSFTDNWTATNLTVARDETSSIPRYTTTKTAFKLTSTATAGTHVSSVMKRDDADLNRTLGLEIAINCANASKWTIDVEVSANGTTGWARSVLRSDSSSKTYLPATIGTFKTSFDTTSATPYMRYVITHEGTAASEILYYSDVLITPDGGTVIGPTVQDDVSITTVVSGIGTGTIDTSGLKFSRIGTKLYLKGTAVFTAAGTGSSDVKLSFTGLTCTGVNGTVTLLKGDGNMVTGSIGRFNATGGGIILITSDNTTVIGTEVGTSSSVIAYLIFNNVVLDVSEYSGGTVNVSGNDVEYAAAADVAEGDWDDNSTTTVSSRNGAAIIGSLSAARFKTVTFPTPIQEGDDIAILLKESGGIWLNANQFRSSATGQAVVNAINAAGDQTGGVSIQKSASNAVVVRFSQYMNAANDDSPAANWESGMRWVVRKVSATSVAGFDLYKPGVSAGLVPAQGLDGRTDGVAVPAGKIGEIKEIGGAGTGMAIASNTYYDSNLGALSLGAGIWDIQLTVYFGLSGATGIQAFIGFIGTASGNVTTGRDILKNYASNRFVNTGTAIDNDYVVTTPVYRVNLSSTTSYYAKSYAYFTGGSVSATAYMRATRIA